LFTRFGRGVGGATATRGVQPENGRQLEFSAASHPKALRLLTPTPSASIGSSTLTTFRT
jgi:hypothetical protein